MMEQECDSFKVEKLGDVPSKINELIWAGYRIVAIELVRMTEAWMVIVVVEAKAINRDALWKMTGKLDDINRYR